MNRNQRFNRLLSRRSALTGGLAAVAGVGVGAVPALNIGRVYPGIQYGSAHLAGQTPDEATEELRRELADFEQRAVTFTFEGQEWSASLADIGFSVDYDEMISLAMAHGRSKGPLDRYEKFVMQREPGDLPLVLRENPTRLGDFLREVATEIDIPATNAKLAREGTEITVIPDEEGRKLNVDTAVAEALEHLRSGDHSVIELSTDPVTPEVRADDLESAREDAWKLVGEPIVFTHNELDYPITPETLITALQIDDHNQASLDPTALHERIEAITQATRRSPTNVMLGWDSGPYVVAEDQDGEEVDPAGIEDAIVDLATKSDRTGALPMRPVKAEARADNIAELGIESHLAYGSSSFVGSSAARAENVRVSARNISYKLVPPGGTFSYNDLQGPITEEHGYVNGTIISGSWVESDIGGGVCQVSTTVFRAAANAGFRFSEWNPHSWRLAFYEADGSDPGLDAAIYQAPDWELDLTFTNPLDSWLLLVVTTDGDWVTAHFYGKNPGWNVEIHPAQVSEPIQPGPPIERENSSLAPGERQMVQSAQPGYLVRVRRVITEADGEVLADGEFVTDYVPQEEAWEVGPGA